MMTASQPSLASIARGGRLLLNVLPGTAQSRKEAFPCLPPKTRHSDGSVQLALLPVLLKQQSHRSRLEAACCQKQVAAAAATVAATASTNACRKQPTRKQCVPGKHTPPLQAAISKEAAVCCITQSPSGAVLYHKWCWQVTLMSLASTFSASADMPAQHRTGYGHCCMMMYKTVAIIYTKSHENTCPALFWQQGTMHALRSPYCCFLVATAGCINGLQKYGQRTILPQKGSIAQPCRAAARTHTMLPGTGSYRQSRISPQ